jgi:transcriptional regulator with XRE-family HTH domain
MQNNIRNIALEKNIKISQIIKETGLSKSYVYDVINKKSSPSIEVAMKIANALKASIQEVFSEQEEQ